jgi:hypothetical protein
VPVVPLAQLSQRDHRKIANHEFHAIGAGVPKRELHVELEEGVSMKKIAVLDNMVQAQILESMLKQHGIPHVMKTYHDAAYDGIFQDMKGWGHVEAADEHRSEILALLADLRAREGQDSQ